MAKKNKPQPTLRQRLLADAEGKLNQMIEDASQKVSTITEGTSVDFYSLMKVASTKHSDTLRRKLIVSLANDKERELEELYNNQQNLALESKDD
jgi:NAD-dependent SIR2 family protein deacetylase